LSSKLNEVLRHRRIEADSIFQRYIPVVHVQHYANAPVKHILIRLTAHGQPCIMPVRIIFICAMSAALGSSSPGTAPSPAPNVLLHENRQSRYMFPPNHVPIRVHHNTAPRRVESRGILCSPSLLVCFWMGKATALW
jgi:hypothetical protein